MASVWIRERQTKNGEKRYRVEYRPGGRDEGVRFAGSFKTKRLATIRAGFVEAELAAGNPRPRLDLTEPTVSPTLSEAADTWP